MLQACKLGPWSSARQLVDARAAAADARRERLAAAADGQEGARCVAQWLYFARMKNWSIIAAHCACARRILRVAACESGPAVLECVTNCRMLLLKKKNKKK
jgi:hypothetical protein